MKRILSILLAIVMIIGMLPMSILTASAADGTWTLVTDVSTLKAGDQVIIAAKDYAFALSTTQASNNRGQASITKNADNTLNTPSSSVQIVTLEEGSSSGTYAFKVSSGYLYCASTSSKNYLRTQSTKDAKASWEITIANTGVATIKSKVANITRNQLMYNNSSSCFACYSSGQKSVCLYKLVVDESIPECMHANTANVDAAAATCTEVGYTAGVYCKDCETYIEGHEEIPANGHSYGDWIVDSNANCTEAGSQHKTCSACGDTQTEAIPATGHNYENGACNVCSAAMPAAVASLITTAAEFTSGEYILAVSSGYAMGAFDNGWIQPVQPVIVGDNVVEIEGGIWTLTVDENTVKITDSNKVTIAPKGGNENGIKSADYSWTWTVNEDGTFTFAGVDSDTVRLANNTDTTNGLNRFRGYKAKTIDDDTKNIYLDDFQLYKVGAGDVVDPEVPTDPTDPVDPSEPVETEPTVPSEPETEPTEPETEPTVPETEPVEEVKIVFELGEDKDTTTHADGSGAAEYSETVGGYTLSITGGVKMYTGANDAKGNGCIKLGTSSAVASFSFTVPSDVISVVINVAGYKAKTVTVKVNGESQAISTTSDNGEYTAITVDTTINKTITFDTTSTGYRAMVNSITFICGKTDHECQWDEGTVTTAATCTTDGVMTYTCTVDGCTMTETIKATGHAYVYGESAITCANCDYNKAYALNTIAEAKAYTETSVVYYLKGVVTYANGVNVYIEDATGGVCVYFATADDAAGIAVGDEILVWDTMTKYSGLIETNKTTAQEYVKVSSGNELPSKVVTIADLKADSTNEYLGERVVIENVTIGVLGTNNTALTDANGNTINIYKAPALSEDISENDVVTVTAIVSTYNGYQLFVNSAADVVKVASGEEVVVETVTIAEAIAGTAGEYYQVEGVVTYVDGRNVYMQDATGGIVVYLTANAATVKVGDMVKAYGALKNYNGLMELDAVDETNVKFFEILSSDNTVETQNVTIAELNADTAYGFHGEKVALTGVYVSYYSYSSQYGNVDYTLNDGNGNTIKISRVKVASEAECYAAGSIVNVDANVSVYKGANQLVTSNDKIVVTGSCGHENTELVNAETATCTETGYTGDTKCTVCGYYTARGEEIAATGHSYDANGVCANNCGIVNVAVVDGAFYTSFEAAVAAANGAEIKLLADIELAELALSANLFVDVNGHVCLVEGVAGAYTVTVKDSATADYETLGVLVSFVGDDVVLKAADGYLMTEEENGDGYFFDAYKLAITHVSLDANKDALGYKAELKGNERVQSAVTSYGFVMGVFGREGKEYKATGNIDDGVFTLRLSNIMKYRAGEKEIVASAFVVFNEDTENKVSTEQYTTSMKATLLAVNEIFDDLSETQKTSVQKLYGQYETVIVKWLEGKINNFAPVSDVVPSEPETPAE